MGQLRPNSPSRCQHIEYRALNERNGKNPNSRGELHYGNVQCSLPKRHEGEHEWMGRKFGAPSAQTKGGDWNRHRCTETEARQVSDGSTVTVRCVRKKNHTADCTPHIYKGRKFGQPLAHSLPRKQKDYDRAN
jgi:hypothetical protein